MISAMAVPSWAGVGLLKRVRTGRSMPSVLRMRLVTWVASRECPPSWKKLSWMPMGSMSSRSDQMAVSARSTGVRGAV